MIKYKVFKQIQYKGCPVIIRGIGNKIYEYLLVYEGKFYGTYIMDKFKWWELWKLLKKEPRTGKEQNTTIHFLEKAAESVIETLQNKDKKENENKPDNRN